ncbi:MAG: protein-tyrosine phosphatase family protein [Tepidiformaceae bacterium]
MTPELYWVDAPAPGRLAVSARPRGGLWLADDLIALRAEGIDTLVCMMVPGELPELQLVDEPELAVAAGLRFTWLAVPDLSTPTHDGVLDGFRGLRDEVLEGRTVAAHCRQGVGRSPLCIASVLVLLGVPPQEAWQRIAAARGRDVPDTAAQGRWVEALAASIESAGSAASAIDA